MKETIIEVNDLDAVTLKVGSDEYKLSNVNGKLKITTTKLGTVLNIIPSCSNVIYVKTNEMFK